MSTQTAEALPRVQGRHQNHALAARRRIRAVQLVSEGMTYQQAADELGYANKGTLHTIVKKALATQLTETVEEHRTLAYSRLERLLASAWGKAREGDLAAVNACVKVVMAEARLMGLDGSERTSPGAGTTEPETVVIGSHRERGPGVFEGCFGLH